MNFKKKKFFFAFKTIEIFKGYFLHFLRQKIFIKILFQRLAQTWLEQSLTAMQTEDDDAKKEKRTTVCLKAVMNDI